MLENLDKIGYNTSISERTNCVEFIGGKAEFLAK